MGFGNRNFSEPEATVARFIRQLEQRGRVLPISFMIPQRDKGLESFLEVDCEQVGWCCGEFVAFFIHAKSHHGNIFAKLSFEKMYTVQYLVYD